MVGYKDLEDKSESFVSFLKNQVSSFLYNVNQVSSFLHNIRTFWSFRIFKCSYQISQVLSRSFGLMVETTCNSSNKQVNAMPFLFIEASLMCLNTTCNYSPVCLLKCVFVILDGNGIFGPII